LYESTSRSGCESERFAAEDEDPNNLVSNPGFEQLYDCPKKREDLQLARAWRIKENSPDFYHVCGTGTAAVPRNELGEQMPYRGEGYGGIWTMLQERQNYREFVATRLKTPLVAGKKYCLSIWVSLAEVSDHALDELQLQITRDDQDQNQCQVGVDTTELITLSNGKILDNWNEWVFLHGTFIAKGNEQTIMIGNYRDNNDRHMHQLKNGPKKGIQFKDCCYYYIDDVGLHAVGDPTCSCPGNLPESIPLPTLPQPDTIPFAASTFQEFKAGDTLILRNLQFEFDKSRLLPKSLPLLDSLADFLKTHSQLQIRLTGHTDSDGEAAYNLKLSESRAGAVMNYLISQAIEPQRMKAAGMGESRPCNSNDSEEGKALNRRVEVEFLEE
jgi:outer membrane protein OmpA-like peptidoglycan-associated protein